MPNISEKRKAIHGIWIRKVVTPYLDQGQTCFGSRNDREGDWNQENEFLEQKQPARKYRTCPVCLPDVSGMRGSIKGPYPFGPGSLSPFSLLQASAATSISSFWRPSDSAKKKEEREIGSKEVCIKIEGFGTWILNLIFILSLSQGTLIL